MYPEAIQKLIDKFSKFPTVGPKTAARFVFYLLKLPREDIVGLMESINMLKDEIKICQFCFKPFQGKEKLCEICSDPRRDKTLICVIEKESDLDAIEKVKKYKGRYFVLGGTISGLRKKDIENIRIAELLERAKDAKEIIIATNPTTEGEATSLYLERKLKPLDLPAGKAGLPAQAGKKITRLGRGLPVGAEIEYADDETIASALEGRK